MMQQMARGGAPAMPGMPGVGMGKKAKGRQAPQPRKAKGRRQSGNPAKRTPAPAADATPESAPGAAFGLGGGKASEDFDPSQLPDLSKYLK